MHSSCLLHHHSPFRRHAGVRGPPVLLLLNTTGEFMATTSANASPLTPRARLPGVVVLLGDDRGLSTVEERRVRARRQRRARLCMTARWGVRRSSRRTRSCWSTTTWTASSIRVLPGHRARLRAQRRGRGGRVELGEAATVGDKVAAVDRLQNLVAGRGAGKR